jgi:hypothetical protein
MHNFDKSDLFSSFFFFLFLCLLLLNEHDEGFAPPLHLHGSPTLDEPYKSKVGAVGAHLTAALKFSEHSPRQFPACGACRPET